MLEYRNKRLMIVLISVFLGFQLSWPVVAYMKWGALKWADTIFHFSWNMELYEKSGSVTFWKIDTVSGRESKIHLDTYLTQHQQKFMAQDPRMILQFANYLKAILPGQVEIRADLSLSMNGREPFVVVEKSKDLFTQLEAYKSGVASK